MPDRAIRPTRTLLGCHLPDTIGCPVCGVKLQVSRDPVSSQQNPEVIWLPNAALLARLTILVEALSKYLAT